MTIEPDEEYENPIGEVLDPDTVSLLASAHLVAMMFRILKVKGGPLWPFS